MIIEHTVETPLGKSDRRELPTPLRGILALVRMIRQGRSSIHDAAIYSVERKADHQGVLSPVIDPRTLMAAQALGIAASRDALEVAS